MLRASILTAFLYSTCILAVRGETAEQEIRHLVAEQVAAWNTGDVPGWVKTAAPDIGFTNIYGVFRTGVVAFTKRQEEAINVIFKGTTKQHNIKRIRFVTPDVALVEIDNEVRGVKSLPPGVPAPPDGVLRTSLLQVFVRRNGRWWMEAFHNVDVKTQLPSRR